MFIDIIIIFNSYVLTLIVFHHNSFTKLLSYLDVSLLLFIIPPFLFFFFVFKIYNSLWEFTSTIDFFRIFISVFLSGILIFFIKPSGVDIQLPFLLQFTLFVLVFLIFVRIAARNKKIIKDGGRDDNRSILIIGAGEAARDVFSDLQKTGKMSMVVGLVDDKKDYKNMTIFGKKVLGTLDDTTRIVEKYTITDIIICIENIEAEKIQQIVDNIDLKQVRVKIIPAYRESILAGASVNRARELRAEDLLGRKPVTLNTQIIKDYFKDNSVLITGAGGSIGSEICHQLLSYPISKLICICRSEYSLYQLKEKITKENFNHKKIVFYIGNIKDKNRMLEVFETDKPDVVFHAAAHKHVPYMEENEREAIKNNILGSENIMHLSSQFDVKKFIFISTDKAVNPTNVMGATKRYAEKLTLYYFHKYGLNTSIVRFGNVLGSRGSVVPLFRKQILDGGPITVTHPDVVRYFMTIPEAALLVVNCAALASGGEKFILDMGEPVNISKLVERMIKFYGYVPGKEITIKYTGLRKGEKIFEELSTKKENVKKTENKKIFICENEKVDFEEIETAVTTLKNKVHVYSREEIRKALQVLVPEYNYFLS